MHRTISSAGSPPSVRSLNVDSGFEFPSDFQADQSNPLIDIDRLMASAGLSSSDKHIAVAVSGGSDSLALALLAEEWSRSHGVHITALTVDHGLRAESAEEASLVGDWLGSNGLSHHVLRWEGEKPASGIQVAARDARYGLMTNWCHTNGVTKLLLGHQLEDQAETFLFRLARGSGPDGLACMTPMVRRGGITLVRPLLTVSRRDLRRYLTEHGRPWIDDPSNENPAYMRTGLGKLSRDLSDRGVPPERLAALATSFAQVRAATDQIVAATMERFGTVHPEGYATCASDTFERLPAAAGQALLRYLLLLIGGKVYAPASGKLDRVVKRLRRPAGFSGLTLGGCVIRPSVRGLLIYRELTVSESETITPGADILWQGVFRCRLDGDVAATPVLLRVAPLGDNGWRQVVQKIPALRETSLPYPVRLTLPALFAGETVCAVPHLEYADFLSKKPGSAVFAPVFDAKFLGIGDR